MKLIKDSITKDVKDENLAKAMIQAGWKIVEEKSKIYERPMEEESKRR